MRLIHHFLMESAQHTPDKTAIICNDQERSYEAFLGGIQSLSARLIDGGLRRGDRVLIVLSDKVYYLTACYAVMAAGGIAAPLSEGSVTTTIEEVAEDSGAVLLLSSAQDLAEHPGLSDRLTCRIWHIEDAMSLSNGLAETKDFQDDAGAMILYTSGTTGKKKGVLLSHRNLVQSALNINAFMQLDSHVREYVAIPFSHSFGFGRSRCVLFNGGTLVFDNGMLNPVLMVRRIGAYHCDAISSVPSGFAMFIGRLEPMLQRIGSQIRYIEIGSATMQMDHKLRLIKLFPNARICMHYGLTEASRSAFIEFRSEQVKLNTVGRPSPNVDVKILDEEGQEAGAMAMGEIAVRGGHVMAGYWQNEELNQQRFTSDNWFKTGDFGFIDEDGYLHLLGRKDEVINMGGLKIAPLEVERAIAELYPGLDICVVGMPDVEGVVGEIPVLCYVSGDDRNLALADLSEKLSDRLEQYKMPRSICKIDALPKTANGKVIRRIVRQRLLDGVAAAGNDRRLVNEGM